MKSLNMLSFHVSKLDCLAELSLGLAGNELTDKAVYAMCENLAREGKKPLRLSKFHVDFSRNALTAKSLNRIAHLLKPYDKTMLDLAISMP